MGHVRGTSSIKYPSIRSVGRNRVCTNHKGGSQGRGGIGSCLLRDQPSFLILSSTLIVRSVGLQLVVFLPGVSFGVEALLLAPGTLLQSFVQLFAFLNPICLFSLVSNGVIGILVKQSEVNILESQVSFGLKVVNDIVH
jgi:hypothetical protein